MGSTPTDDGGARPGPRVRIRPHTVTGTSSGWHTTRITGVGIAGAGIVLEPARPFLLGS